MLRLSYWQWNRYIAKEAFLEELDARLEMPAVPLDDLLQSIELKDLNVENEELNKLLHRRVLVSGEYDFEYEFVKRNRRDESDGPGVHVITPFLPKNFNTHVLVNRGYIPLSVKSKEARKQFHKDVPQNFVALVKLTEIPRSFLSPIDPPAGDGKEWVDAWLRVNIEEVQKQIPHKLLPIQLELISKISDSDKVTTEELEKALVSNSNARNEIFYLSDNMNKVSTGELNPEREYPIPAFSTVVPSATHLLYVFEWAFMALLTLLICLGLQFKKTSQKISLPPAGR